MENKTLQTLHFANPYLFNPSHPITISVVGCGGTGSLLLPRLARLDQALEQLGHPGLFVRAYDDDVVEKHNVGRQNFTKHDIGKNKALALIEKINFAYGLQWEAFNKRCNEVPKGNIIITCVDNVSFRKTVDVYSKSFLEEVKCDYDTPMYWLDCGNGKDFGQVILATIGAISQPKNSKYRTCGVLKSVYDIYGNLEQFDTKDTQGIESCSFIESIQQQDLFINDAISVNAVDLLWRLFIDLKLEYHGIILNQKDFKQRGLLIR